MNVTHPGINWRCGVDRLCRCTVDTNANDRISYVLIGKVPDRCTAELEGDDRAWAIARVLSSVEIEPDVVAGVLKRSRD